MKKCISIFKLTLAIALISHLCGCSSFHQLKSLPPAPVISLTAPAIAHGLFTSAIFPPAEYTAVWEDDRGFYYLAPEKIVAKDIFTYRYDGGLYLKKGSNVPKHYFVLNHKGQPSIGKFDALPQFRLVQNPSTNSTAEAYDRIFIKAIEEHWHQLLGEIPDASRTLGKVVVTFQLHPDGTVSELQVVSGTLSDIAKATCLRAIRDSAPFNPWTEAMRQKIKADKRDIRFTFYFEN